MAKIKRKNFEKTVYIGHPCGGLKENIEETALIFRQCVKNFPNIFFISPVNAFNELYKDSEYWTDYDVGMEYCYHLLNMCDELWMFGDWKNSKGCRNEIKFCEENSIPYIKLNMINL